MTDVEKPEWIAGYLESVPFVEWGRFTVDERKGYQFIDVYGWIERDEDDYKDFVWSRFWPHSETVEFTTSSDRYSEDLVAEWFGEDSVDDHIRCRRVEHTFDVENAVELGEQTTLTDGGLYTTDTNRPDTSMEWSE